MRTVLRGAGLLISNEIQTTQDRRRAELKSAPIAMQSRFHRHRVGGEPALAQDGD